MRLFFTGLLLTIATTVLAQENYDVSLIPKNLLPYASAVVRSNDVEVEVKAADNVIYHLKTAVTVFNKNGDHMAHVVIFHDKKTILKNVKGLVYNEFGKQVSKFSESNFEDESAINDFSLFEDTRVKHFMPAVTEYPYTVTYEYEVRSKQSLNIDDWMPISRPGVAVENCSYNFTCKPDFAIRYKASNIPDKVTINTDPAGLKTYYWHISNLKAVKDEPYSPNPETYLPSVKIAPEKFTYEGIKGEYSDWTGLGKWIYDKLLVNRDELPPSTINDIQYLTQGTTNPKEKARRVYEYMQKKTHYISVQVGIGGYQPFLAADVDKQNYGDCKALVYYTQALLKAVNIESYYCVVTAGEEKISMIDDFASMQGNHVILCIPFKNDTTWLECTSQKIPFGFLGDFTDDRTVLACTPQGGKLMHTPKYTAQNSLQQRKASFALNADGELLGNMETSFNGVQYENREGIIQDSQTEQVKDLKKIYPINNLEIEKFDFKQDKGLQPVTTESIKFTAPEYASVAGGKIYFMLNPVNRITQPHLVRNRQTDIYISRGQTDEDEISYTIPKGYRLEKAPLNVNINKPFGSYTVTMALTGDKLIYKRKMQLLDGTYSKGIYPEMVDFYSDIYDADNYNVTLVKSN